MINGQDLSKEIIVITFNINWANVAVNIFLRYLLIVSTTAKINVRENRRAIKNEQSRDTGNIGYTRHKEEDREDEDKQSKKNTTQKTEKMV